MSCHAHFSEVSTAFLSSSLCCWPLSSERDMTSLCFCVARSSKNVLWCWPLSSERDMTSLCFNVARSSKNVLWPSFLTPGQHNPIRWFDCHSPLGGMINQKCQPTSEFELNLFWFLLKNTSAELFFLRFWFKKFKSGGLKIEDWRFPGDSLLNLQSVASTPTVVVFLCWANVVWW